MSVPATVLRFSPRLRRVDLEALTQIEREETAEPIARITVHPPINLDERRSATVHESSGDYDPLPPAPAMALVA